MKKLPFLMWIFPLFFFAYQFILRLWPSLMKDQIMSQFSIDATAFGLLAAMYYGGYAGLQIPIAIALEKYGPRLMISICVFLCGLAAFLFFFTEQWYLALFARFLIGAASGVGFLGTSKVISQWFPKEYYTRMVGFTFMFGLSGAVYGGKPVSLLIANFGWQSVAFTVAAVGIVIAIFIYVFLREPQKTYDTATQTVTLQDFKQLLRSPFIWVLAVVNLLMVGALEGFADVWGTNYLMMAYQLDKPTASELNSLIFVGMLFGGPLLAFLAGRLGSYIILSFCGAGITFALIQILFFQNTPYILALLLFFIGLLSCYQVLIFSIGCDFVPIALWGVTVAFLNCANMSGGAFFHVIIGFMTDVFWTGAVGASGLREYPVMAYQYSLLVIPICAMLGALIIAAVGWRKRGQVA